MKIKKIFLSFVLMMSMLCVVACKDKDKEPEPATPPKTKSESVVHPSVADRVYLIGEKLEDIELLLAMGDTNGAIAWDDEDYVLVQGENECAWTFTPSDTESFKTKTGSLTIEAIKLETPVVTGVELVPDQTVYIEQKYALIRLQGTATFGGETVEGTFGWKEPNKEFVEGNNECTWVFKPTDKTRYTEVEGTISVEATVEQVPEGLVVVKNTKPQYVAFETIDLSALTLHIRYSGGKSVPIDFDVNDVTITYNTGNTLRKGDRKATISHDMYGFVTEITLNEVDYRTVQVPEFNQVHVYNGHPQVLTLANNSDADKYTFESRTETDADDYGILVTLNNPLDDRWSNGDLETTTVVCTIQKAELVEEETNYSKEYDGQAHSVSVTNQTENEIYYSETELDETNFSGASTEPISKTNAGEYTVYYYMTGDKNHNPKAGSLTIAISKQTPIMNLEHCYTLKTGNVVNYPESYISIVDKQGNIVDLGDLRFTYYSSYTNDGYDGNDILTSSADGVEAGDGTAPKNDKTTEYYVLVSYAGSDNYNAVTNQAVLFIDGADLGLYAKSGEDSFAYKYDENGDYGVVSPQNGTPISGSYSECNAYVEFEALALDETTGLKIVKFYSKFGTGSASKKDGRLVFAGGKYLLMREDGVYYTYTPGASTEEIVIQIGEGSSSTYTLKKWNLPKYLNTFVSSTKTVTEYYDDPEYDQTKNTSEYSEIEFYNDYGTIRFIARVNVDYIGSDIDDEGQGGYVEWIGVAEIGVNSYKYPDGDPNNGMNYVLDCKVSNSATGYPESVGSRFSIIWHIGNATTEVLDPSSVKLIDDEGSSLFSLPFETLVNVVFNKETV